MDMYMSNENNKIRIGLLENGAHSLTKGYESWSDWEKNRDNIFLLKESIIWIHHGIELLLKQLLFQKDETLIFEKVDNARKMLQELRVKNKDAGAFELIKNNLYTIEYSKLPKTIHKNLNIDELSIDSQLCKDILSLAKLRNEITHFSIEFNVTYVTALLSSIVDPIQSLLSREIDDCSFKEKYIPKLLRLALPLQEYMARIRAEIVKNAVEATCKPLPPNEVKKAGIVYQSLGTGLSKSLSDYLNNIYKNKALRESSIIVMVDRKIIQQQLHHVLSVCTKYDIHTPKSATEFEHTFKQNHKLIIILTVQQAFTYKIVLERHCLIIGYTLSSTPIRISPLFKSATYISFTNVLNDQEREFFGYVIAKYDVRQSIEDGFLVPLKIENFTAKYQKNIVNNISYDNYHEDWMDDLNLLAKKIIHHFELRYIKKLGKAVVLVRNTNIAEMLFSHIIKIRPEWYSKNHSPIVSIMSSKYDKRSMDSLYRDSCNKDSRLSLIVCTGDLLGTYENRLLDTAYITYHIPSRVKKILFNMITYKTNDKPDGLIINLTTSNITAGFNEIMME